MIIESRHRHSCTDVIHVQRCWFIVCWLYSWLTNTVIDRHLSQCISKLQTRIQVYGVFTLEVIQAIFATRGTFAAFSLNALVSVGLFWLSAPIFGEFGKWLGWGPPLKPTPRLNFYFSVAAVSRLFFVYRIQVLTQSRVPIFPSMLVRIFCLFRFPPTHGW